MRQTAMGKAPFTALIALAILGLVQGAPASSGPRIGVSEENYNFGRIPNDRAVEHVFKVKNTGDRPLVVTGVRTSCGCTAAMMESSVIEPGGVGNLRVSFNPKGGKGQVSRSITVSSNDPVKADLILKVSAEPHPPTESDKPAVPAKRTHERRARLELDGKCAQCHAPRKGGSTGKKLYSEACVMCHGALGEGITLDGEPLGPSMLRIGAGVLTDAGIKQTITAGTGHPWMPGFGAEYGGPLSDKQVESLVKLFKNKFKEK